MRQKLNFMRVFILAHILVPQGCVVDPLLHLWMVFLFALVLVLTIHCGLRRLPLTDFRSSQRTPMSRLRQPGHHLRRHESLGVMTLFSSLVLCGFSVHSIVHAACVFFDRTPGMSLGRCWRVYGLLGVGTVCAVLLMNAWHQATPSMFARQTSCGCE